MQLIVKKLCGERGGEELFSDLGFTMKNGEALVVMGENGSGKSTLLRILAGLLEPLSGDITLSGMGDHDVEGDFSTMALACHYLGHQNAMKPALSVRENLNFWRDFYGHENLTVDDALEIVHLSDVIDLPFEYLSTGQRRRIAIAKLLTNDRPIWLLDEPTAGLDQRSVQVFADIMATHREDGGIVIAATHLPLGLEPCHNINLDDYK